MSGLCSEAGGVYSGSLNEPDIASVTSSCCTTCLCKEGGVLHPKRFSIWYVLWNYLQSKMLLAILLYTFFLLYFSSVVFPQFRNLE